MSLIYDEGQEHTHVGKSGMTTHLCKGYQKQDPEPFSTVPFGQDLNFVDRPSVVVDGDMHNL